MSDLHQPWWVKYSQLFGEQMGSTQEKHEKSDCSNETEGDSDKIT